MNFKKKSLALKFWHVNTLKHCVHLICCKGNNTIDNQKFHFEQHSLIQNRVRRKSVTFLILTILNCY